MIPKFFYRYLALAGTALLATVSLPAAAATITLTIDDSGTCTGTWTTTGTGSGTTLTCVTGTPPPPTSPAAPTCVQPANPTITVGQSTTLSLTGCTVVGGGTITYLWKQGPTPISTTSSMNTGALASTTTYVGTATANNLSTSYNATVTVNPIVSAGSCAGLTAINLGDIRFDGSQTDSSGMRGTAVAYGRLVMPTGAKGMTASLTVFANGNTTAWRKINVSRSPCDFTTKTSQGVTASSYLAFDTPQAGYVTVTTADTWYVNIRNEDANGKSTCGAGYVCDFGLRAYPAGF